MGHKNESFVVLILNSGEAAASCSPIVYLRIQRNILYWNSNNLTETTLINFTL